MRRLSLFSPMRVRDEERGAVLAIVAISLICLLGMLVLTFDLGRGVALKRNMVNAADSAALAAARECGLANGELEAKNAADQLIADNNNSAYRSGFDIDQEPQCSGMASDGERQVTVTVSVPQQYFFAQIFGFNNGTVTATATAEWTMGDTSPAPLKIDQLKVDQCVEGVPDPVTKRVDCYFLFDKGKDGLESDWGWLNLPEGWPNKELDPPDPNPKKCSSQAGGSKDLGDYIGSMGGIGTPDEETVLPGGLWDTTEQGNPPTWVCGATGLKQDNVEDIQHWVDDAKAWMNEVDPPRDEPAVLFPVVACDGLALPCHEWKYTPGVAYPVVKLQPFYVKEAQKGKKYAKEHCGYTGTSDRVFCVHLQWSPDLVGGSGGSVKVWLVD